MTYRIKRLLARHAPLIALLIGVATPDAFAQQLRQPAAGLPEPASRSMDYSPPDQPKAGGQSMSEFEKMDLYHRRYTTAANNMAQLFKQLNQKIEEVSLAAKTVEAKDSSHNRRLLEAKLNQLENARQSYSVQYSQLQSQMQNEYRNYAALSSDLRAKYDTDETAIDSRKQEDTGSDSTSAKAKSPKNKNSPTGNTKNANDTQAWNAKTSQPQTGELPPIDKPAKDPRVLDMDTRELRERRDGATKPATSNLEPAQGVESAPEPALSIIR